MSKITLFKETCVSVNHPGIPMDHIKIYRLHPDGARPVGHTS